MKFLNQIDGAKDLVQDSNNRLVTDAEKTTWNEKDQIPLVIGTQTVTTASWTGVASTVESLYSGLTIRYWLPRTSASNVTLNLTLKGGGTTGAINCYYGGTSRLTTHYGAGSFIIMTYLENALINGTQYTGWWAHSQYVDGTESYAVRWNAAVKVGVEVTQYKLLVQGVDGKYYPTLIGNTTAGTKTVSTVPFLIGAPIIFYGTTATVAADALTSATYNYTAITTSSTSYAFNQTSGFLANADLYLKGTIVGATFILDNTTLTSHLTQTLPTTEDGFFYKRLGVSTNTTTGFRLTLQHPIYYFADGQLQSLDSSQIANWDNILNRPTVFPPDTHTHLKAQVTDLGNLAGISTNASTSNYLRGDGTWVTPPNTVYTLPVAGASLGGVKSGTDITVDASGNVSVNDNSHNHTNYILLDDTIHNTNPFGGRKLYINTLDNVLSAGHRKYFVTITLHKKKVLTVDYPKAINAGNILLPQWEDSPVVSNLSSSAGGLFDNNYEGGISIPSDSYLKVRLDFTEDGLGYFQGYPYGTYYLSYYNTNTPSLAQVRCYNGYSGHTIGYKTLNFGDYIGTKDSSSYIQKCSDGGNYQRRELEFIIIGHDAHNTTLTEIEWKLVRPNFAMNSPIFSNYGNNKSYHAMYFGNQTLNKVSIFPTGEVIADTFQGALSGNSTSSDKLATARTISLTGDVTGSVSFDGSDNVSITATVADDSHNHTIANVDGLQTALDGKVDDSQVLTNVPAGAKFTDTVYTHPTTAGNKHIPSGGATGQFLKWSSNGTATWANDVADLAGAGRTTETVKGNADAIANRALTLNNGAEQTVTDKNKYYPLLSNADGVLIGTHQTNIWDGSSWRETNNYGFGSEALSNNTGSESNGFGYQALSNNIGSLSNGFGYFALQNNTGENSNGFGAGALMNNTGERSNGFGTSALSNNTGSYSNGFGYNAMAENEGSSSNGFGYNALSNNIGQYSNGFGYQALSGNEGEYSNGFGSYALQNNRGAHSNGFGSYALSNNTGGLSNGFGAGALSNNTGAASNGFGNEALQNNTGTESNGFGSYALSSNTGENSNGFGYQALQKNTGAYSNGFGYTALKNNTGEHSSGFGSFALSLNTGMFSNGFGLEALQNNTGDHSSGFGAGALYYNQSPNNTAIGNGANGIFLTNIAGAKTCAYTNIYTTTSRATITAHGFGAANTVVILRYSATTGTAIGGLVINGYYQAKIIDANTIEFVEGSKKRNLTSRGTGTHTFTPQFAYSNTTCLGASTVPNKSNQVVLGDTAVDTVKMGGTARTPASATATGVKGEMCWDANHIHVCTDTDIWKSAALTSKGALTAVEAEIQTARAGSATLTDEIQKRARTLNNGALQTVADKNKYYPLLSNVAGALVARHQTNVWDGWGWLGVNNYGFGFEALLNNTGAGSNGFGTAALRDNIGTESNGFGTAALLNNTGAESNGFGSFALQNNTGTSSNGFGFYALQSNTGYNSNGFGNQALQYNTGNYSNGFGYFALHSNTGQASNGFGYYALQYNTGQYSNGFGYYVLQSNAGAYSNGFGHGAMSNNTGAFSNGFGYNALLNNTGAQSNGFGYNTLLYNQASNNIAIGHNAYSSFLTNSAGAKTCSANDINTTTSRATITAHGFGANNTVVNLLYSAATGTKIGGLALNSVFQAKIIDANTIEFVSGSQKPYMWSAGTGTHTFTPQFAYENTTCLGASTVPNRHNQVVLGNYAVDTVKMGGTTRTIPNANNTGVKGEMCWDENYVYVCVATNTWKRAALSTW